MQRPDLGPAYSGWQAIDSTPQERSDDMFRVGPASVFAVKQGEIKRPYDNTFLYAEVNADKVSHVSAPAGHKMILKFAVAVV